MRWYWVITCENTLPQPFVGSEGDLGLGEFEEHQLTTCKFIENWPDTAWTRAGSPSYDGDPDDSLQTCFTVPIYSSRLCDALNSAGFNGLQFLPVQVIRYDSKTIPGFCAANVLNCVDALDRARSRYKIYPDDYFHKEKRGQVRSIDIGGHVLRLSALVKHDMIRLSNFKPSLFVSERFVDLFERNEFTGYSFREVKTSG